MTRRGSRALGCAALAAFAVSSPALADLPSASGDGAPPGMVAFFDGATCPDGWKVASYAQGRLVVAVTSGVFVGTAVGLPLKPEEDRAHAHFWSSMITLAVKSVSAAGGGNNSAAAAQAYPLSGLTASAPSGLPFIQLLPCERKP